MPSTSRNMLTVVHTTDPTTKALANLYEGRTDVALRITEKASNASVVHALVQAQSVMLLGHGNEWGLFSTPDSSGHYDRLIVSGRHAEFLRPKPCIGIWCHADAFARRYGLHGLFSGMIISEMEEAKLYGVPTTEEELKEELDRFAHRLAFCIEQYGPEGTPEVMKTLDDKQSPLTRFNYERLFYT